jgi:hypothetical protein
MKIVVARRVRKTHIGDDVRSVWNSIHPRQFVEVDVPTDEVSFVTNDSFPPRRNHLWYKTRW